MLCLKRTKSRFMIYFGAFLLSLLFTSVFGSSSSFATSTSCRIDNNGSPLLQGFLSISDYCDISSLDSSLPWYYYGSFSAVQIDRAYLGFQDSNFSCNVAGQGFPFSNPYYPVSNYNIPSAGFSYDNPPVYPFIVRDRVGVPVPSGCSFSPHYDKIGSSYNGGLMFIELTISDTIEIVQPTNTLNVTENGTYNVVNYGYVDVDVPDTIIYGDYHNDLIAINNSIMVCASVCLVIYFFYCIYRMIIRSSK